MGRSGHRTGRAPGDRVHGELSGSAPGAFEEVYALVRAIPEGRVTTYGRIATALGNRLSPRAVGWALHGCPPDVPWQRVVNARGTCSTDRLPNLPAGLQRRLLEDEGVTFDERGRLNLGVHLWQPVRGAQHAPEGNRNESR
jgi:methylated-DNA-protein-cysteine methyltransferase-like protein